MLEVLEVLRKACDDVREAAPDDAVDGVQPAYVVRPGSVDEVAEVLRASDAARVVVRGSGSKLGWGAPPAAVDVLLDVGRLDRVLDYNPGDLVLAAGAGAPLDVVQREVGEHDQLLGLDPPEPGATLGGIVAANATGPRRVRYGSARDLLIGVAVVLADGTVARAGGKVVKNVAGYDLMKLFSGSLGTLGVVVETTWRLHPRPPARRVVTAAYDPARLRELLHSALTPTAVEVTAGPDRPAVTVVFETIPPSADAQAATAAQLLAGEVGAELPAGFGERPWRPGGVGLRVGCPIAAVPSVLAALTRRPDAVVVGRVTVGALEVGLPDLDPAELRRLRADVPDCSVVVCAAPPERKRELDVWGPVGDSLPLMRRVKERFDPERRLAPGRFVGGI